uniref:Uncharacterized protein n=1 Tax=Noccaea caerulescens TaxID=107243 RepID=A0A1J3K6I3_NOCCA
MSTSNPPVLNSPFQISTFPKNFQRSASSSASSSSIHSLYEVEYVPGDQLPETTLPLINPYEYFAKKPNTFSIKGVRELIRPSSFSKRVLEYVQASKFSSCQIPATEEEQFVSLTIPEHLPRLWQQQGFTQRTLLITTVWIYTMK